MSASIFVDLDRTGQWFVFCSPYNESFIFELKARVPAKFRRWVADQKAWCVARKHWPTTEKLLRKHYGHDMQFEVGPAAEAAQVDLLVEEVHEPTAMDYMKLGVRADAPHCVLHAAYHALEALWTNPNHDEIRLLGVYPIDEVREAYKRACQLRGIHHDPSPFYRVSHGVDPNTSMDHVPPPTDADYGPGYDAFTRSSSSGPLEFVEDRDD
jgi:hypothetical protein